MEFSSNTQAGRGPPCITTIGGDQTTIVLDPQVENRPGSTIVRKPPLREQVTAFLANFPLRVIEREACGSHITGHAKLHARGHMVQLTAPGS